MSITQDARYVKSELLGLVLTAQDNGIIGEVAFLVTDGVLEAETYNDEGEIEARWVVDVTVTYRSGEGDSAMSEQNEAITRIETALTDYRQRGPSGSIAIDLASALREAHELLSAFLHMGRSDGR